MGSSGLRNCTLAQGTHTNTDEYALDITKAQNWNQATSYLVLKMAHATVPGRASVIPFLSVCTALQLLSEQARTGKAQ